MMSWSAPRASRGRTRCVFVFLVLSANLSAARDAGDAANLSNGSGDLVGCVGSEHSGGNCTGLADVGKNPGPVTCDGTTFEVSKGVTTTCSARMDDGQHCSAVCDGSNQTVGRFTCFLGFLRGRSSCVPEADSTPIEVTKVAGVFDMQVRFPEATNVVTSELESNICKSLASTIRVSVRQFSTCRVTVEPTATSAQRRLADTVQRNCSCDYEVIVANAEGAQNVTTLVEQIAVPDSAEAKGFAGQMSSTGVEILTAIAVVPARSFVDYVPPSVLKSLPLDVQQATAARNGKSLVELGVAETEASPRDDGDGSLSADQVMVFNVLTALAAIALALGIVGAAAETDTASVPTEAALGGKHSFCAGDVAEPAAEPAPTGDRAAATPAQVFNGFIALRRRPRPITGIWQGDGGQQFFIRRHGEPPLKRRLLASLTLGKVTDDFVEVSIVTDVDVQNDGRCVLVFQGDEKKTTYKNASVQITRVTNTELQVCGMEDGKTRWRRVQPDHILTGFLKFTPVLLLFLVAFVWLLAGALLVGCIISLIVAVASCVVVMLTSKGGSFSKLIANAIAVLPPVVWLLADFLAGAFPGCIAVVAWGYIGIVSGICMILFAFFSEILGVELVFALLRLFLGFGAMLGFGITFFLTDEEVYLVVSIACGFLFVKGLADLAKAQLEMHAECFREAALIAAEEAREKEAAKANMVEQIPESCAPPTPKRAGGSDVLTEKGWFLQKLMDAAEVYKNESAYAYKATLDSLGAGEPLDKVHRSISEANTDVILSLNKTLRLKDFHLQGVEATKWFVEEVDPQILEVEERLDMLVQVALGSRIRLCRENVTNNLKRIELAIEDYNAAEDEWAPHLLGALTEKASTLEFLAQKVRQQVGALEDTMQLGLRGCASGAVDLSFLRSEVQMVHGDAKEAAGCLQGMVDVTDDASARALHGSSVAMDSLDQMREALQDATDAYNDVVDKLTIVYKSPKLQETLSLARMKAMSQAVVEKGRASLKHFGASSSRDDVLCEHDPKLLKLPELLQELDEVRSALAQIEGVSQNTKELVSMLDEQLFEASRHQWKRMRKAASGEKAARGEDVNDRDVAVLSLAQGILQASHHMLSEVEIVARRTHWTAATMESAVAHGRNLIDEVRAFRTKLASLGFSETAVDARRGEMAVEGEPEPEAEHDAEAMFHMALEAGAELPKAFALALPVLQAKVIIFLQEFTVPLITELQDVANSIHRDRLQSWITRLDQSNVALEEAGRKAFNVERKRMKAAEAGVAPENCWAVPVDPVPLLEDVNSEPEQPTTPVRATSRNRPPMLGRLASSPPPQGTLQRTSSAPGTPCRTISIGSLSPSQKRPRSGIVVDSGTVQNLAGSLKSSGFSGQTSKEERTTLRPLRLKNPSSKKALEDGMLSSPQAQHHPRMLALQNEPQTPEQSPAKPQQQLMSLTNG
eukprot:TRINITY_DN38151_c0_g1_i1.p1 TRINITY_DN38151_c0_g1~~TRINITY_DN38151_c0_g1_i1.p1  ORF type:complete len:1436 (-),score=299.57 TRINITY_DN38151_c0_g1_i1:115-4422(-)